MAMADGGMAGVFDHVMVDGGSQIASQPGISTDSNMPVAGPWDGAPFTDPDSVPRYIAEAAPPAGRRWGSDVAPDDPDGGRLVDRCRALLDHRHTEYARQGLAKAAKRFRAQSNGAATAECYVMLGRASELRFDHTVALEWYEQALNLFESLGDLAGVSDCCAMTGHLRFLHGDLDGAFAYFDRALRSDEECQDELRIAAGYRRVGIILEERNKPKQARSLFRKAAEIEDRNKDRYAYSRSLNHQSRVARKLESFDDAEKLMQESLQIKEELDDDTGLATGYHELGNLRLEQSAFESALESYEQALEIEERLKDLQGIAVTMSQLGLVHRSLQNDVDSARCFGIARDLFHRLQSPYVVIVDQALDQVREIVDAAVFHDTQWEARAYLDDLLEGH